MRKWEKETCFNLQSNGTKCEKRNHYRAVGRGNNYSGHDKQKEDKMFIITLWQMEKGSPATVTKTAISQFKSKSSKFFRSFVLVVITVMHDSITSSEFLGAITTYFPNIYV